MHLIDAVNVPGKGEGTGDDRYGFDEAAGVAWVIDGATDVGPVRLFPHMESDAAWLAQALSDRFMSGPRPDESARDYLARALADVNARMAKEASVSMDTAPRDTWPVASLIWMRVRGGVVEFASIGDCAAVISQGAGAQSVADIERSEDEVTRAGALQNLSWEEKLPTLRADRVRYNSPGFIWPDEGRAPAALDVLERTQVRTPCCARPSADDADGRPARGHVLLMSDGLYRLVAPFAAMDDAGLLSFALEQGLGAAITRLRALETAPDGPARYKTSDDAAGLLLAL